MDSSFVLGVLLGFFVVRRFSICVLLVLRLLFLCLVILSFSTNYLLGIDRLQDRGTASLIIFVLFTDSTLVRGVLLSFCLCHIRLSFCLLLALMLLFLCVK